MARAWSNVVAGNAMRYRITRHWPHPQPDDLPWHVYLKGTQRDEAAHVSVGDVVLFYETGAFLIDGRATTSVRSNDYGDADYREWNLEIPCESRQARRPLPHDELARIVGFRMYFKGALREISRAQFTRVQHATQQ